MSDRKWMALFLLTVSIFVAGCAKKSSEETNIASTGFDSATATPATTTEELAQLPQAGASSLSTSVEALPIDAAPVTQSVSTIPAALEAGTGKALSHDQEIQTALKNAGLYNGKIDGKLGPASKRAIEEFQTQNGLKVDGKVGPKTWTALSAHLNTAGAEVPAGNQ